MGSYLIKKEKMVFQKKKNTDGTLVHKIKKKPRVSMAVAKRIKGENFKTNIYNVLKEIHPDTSLSTKSMAILNGMVIEYIDKIAHECDNLVRREQYKTVSKRTIESAVLLTIPGELGKHAIQEGEKAVVKYREVMSQKS